MSLTVANRDGNHAVDGWGGAAGNGTRHTGAVTLLIKTTGRAGAAGDKNGNTTIRDYGRGTTAGRDGGADTRRFGSGG